MDRNGGNLIDADDVTGFALALNDPGGVYKLTYGINGNASGDFDRDGWLTFDDIRLFKAAAIGSGMSYTNFNAVFNAALTGVPEPANAGMLLIALFIHLASGRRRWNGRHVAL
jgi:hypothetical protein